MNKVAASVTHFYTHTHVRYDRCNAYVQLTLKRVVPLMDELRRIPADVHDAFSYRRKTVSSSVVWTAERLLAECIPYHTDKAATCQCVDSEAAIKDTCD